MNRDPVDSLEPEPRCARQLADARAVRVLGEADIHGLGTNTGASSGGPGLSAGAKPVMSVMFT